MRKKLLFLTLNTFSAMGGIEKVCRIAAKALHEIADETGGRLAVYSMYDKSADADTRYLPSDRFKGFGGKRAAFVARAVVEGARADTVVLSHVNLLLPGYLIKLVSPRTKLVLVAHGIELWDKLGGWKAKMLKKVDLFLPVSGFTARKLETVQGIPAEKIRVLNNCLDPYLERKREPEKEKALKTKYGFGQNDFVLLTLSRLRFSEQYKGYDKVVRALASLKDSHPQIRYLIVGKYDAEEKARLDAIIAEQGMRDRVVFAGFVPDEDLVAHFNIADAYIMPSTGEGFGVVFIEALFYGKPVIAGNVDGSVDALGGGEFGLLVNPHEQKEIEAAIKQLINKGENDKADDHRIIERFGYPRYKKNWSVINGTPSKARVEEHDLSFTDSQ